MSWWIFQANRANTERESITVLEEQSPWLSNVCWSLDDDQLIVSFDITYDGEVFELKMLYPPIFPDTPPLVYTRKEVRISDHQYGPTGELCLEYRSDNWEETLDGSNMIESAHRLIRGERSTDEGLIEIRDGHNVSLGQLFRKESLRFLIDPEQEKIFNGLTPYAPYTIELRSNSVQKIYSTRVDSVKDKDTLVWRDDLSIKPNTWIDKGLIIFDPDGKIDTTKELEEIDKDLEIFVSKKGVLSGVKKGKDVNLLVGSNEKWSLTWFYEKEGEIKRFHYKTIQSPSHQERLPATFQNLQDKTVGIVGCGSVGSKVAVSLIRSGLNNILLIDDDIFWSGNLVRNELDGLNVGYHKVDSLKERIERINPSAKVEIRKVAFGGQESSATTTSVYQKLGKCNAIIDATANDKTFSLCASISQRYKIPLIWCAVYAGGVGGLIARAIPDIDPIPQLAKKQIYKWYEEQNTEWNFVGRQENYSVLTDNELPMVASDADVSVISSHATRFLIDSLLNPENPQFPYSAYVIGLSNEWLFEQPFDTRPIKLKPAGQWGELEKNINKEEIIKLLKATSNDVRI
ncbi:ThiF family adenylyltransferase [Desulforhopalus sp. 52FAK]